MAISFGIAKKIIDHPSYNLGLALPFVCAFYVLNANEPYIIPIIDFELGQGLGMVLNILGVAFYYIISLLMFLLGGGISKMVGESKGWLFFLLGFFFITSLYSFLTNENVPRVGLLFGVLSVLYLLLLFLKMEDGSLSAANDFYRRSTFVVVICTRNSLVRWSLPVYRNYCEDIGTFWNCP